MPRDSLTLEQFKSLCDYDGQKYISKKGINYIQALSELFWLNNVNDKPFTIEDIKKQPELSTFTFEGVKDYKKICKLRVKPLEIIGKIRKNEKISPVEFESEEAKDIFEKALGVSYIFTCVVDNKEHIIKIGSSRTTFKDRLGSYNCGVVNNWRTASTTNIKILQSMVTTRLDLNLYLYDCGESQTFEWHGVTSVPFATSKQLAVEDILVKQFITQYGFKPLANVQVGATEI